jgi:RNA polymerase sigma factor (sigma-70 family)
MPDPQPKRDDKLNLLIEGVLSHDERQWKVLRVNILRYAQFHSHHPRIDPEDITTETMLILFENLKSDAFRGDSLVIFTSYIHSIVRNRISKAWKAILPEATLDKMPEASSPDLDGLMTSRRTAEQLLDKIGPKCATLLRYRFMEGMNNQELATKIGKNEGATRTAISRCIAQLRKLVQ